MTNAALVATARLGAVAAAAVLALTSTGTMFVAGALVVFALGERLRGVAVLLAVAAVAVRFGTISFEEVAGIQSVLGPAVRFGPPAAAASALAAAIAVVAATRAIAHPAVPALVGQVAPAVATGALAGAIATGPGPGGDLGVRVAGTVVAIVVAWSFVAADAHRARAGRTGRRTTAPMAKSKRSRRRSLASVRASAAAIAGLVAVVLAGWPT